MCFLNIEPRKHITLLHITQLLFLAASCDPFNFLTLQNVEIFFYHDLINVGLHNFLTIGSSAVNGYHQNDVQKAY